MAANLFKISLSLSTAFPAATAFRRRYIRRSHSPILSPLPHNPSIQRRRNPNFVAAKAVELNIPTSNSTSLPENQVPAESSFLLDVGGMMCGGCVTRVKKLLVSDDRVESAVVNMLTETAAVRLKSEVSGGEFVAEELAKRLYECGFEAKKRVPGNGVGERVKKWKEMAVKKEELVEKSRNRVIFAWTLVALCCGSHTSHILHFLGIHVAHGGIWDVLHNAYVKGGLALGALLGPGRDLLFDGIKAFAKGSPNMNSLVGFGSVAAFILSAVSLVSPELEWNASFFDEPVMLLGFVLLGRSLEERARIKASSDMNELLSLISTQARLVITSSESDSSANEVLASDAICIEVPTDDIRVGDTVLVLPGETVPVDGKVIAGRSVVDESMLTGESLPVFKEAGLFVSAGTINWDGPIRIEATSTGSNSTISKIIHMVEDAQSNEAPIQRLADSIAGPFVYSVMAFSLMTFAFWSSIGTKLFPDVLLNDIAGPEGSTLILSLKLAVDVLVVSCPCALGLATPTAILVGTSIGARQGLLLRGGDVLERLAGIDYMAFDKTGTLTEGKPTVSAVASLAYNSSEILQLAAAVEETTSHPLANAILSKAKSFGALEWVRERFETKNLSDITDLERALMLESAKPTSSLDKSETVVYVGREGEGVIGAIAISDALRHDAVATVARLKGMGIKPVLLSGDREEAVAKVAKIVGISREFVEPSLNPQRKSQFISDIQASGHRVAMVGDGINDAPSLALADVGIALKTGLQENAASDAASIVLLGNRISQVEEAVDLARATMSKVHQNLLWAVAYNVVTIPVAAGVLLPHFDFAMTPSLSGGLMALSSIFVVSNSLLLQLHGSNKEKKELASGLPKQV
ncbi:copper-transporting ATPase PAA2, chloroplastic-like isoform X2 [Chenopodium quinoa]|uniref:copper-transporting ATPase PAA2, chloroplastic-like isoform X2 n=1 Tax=Chenopodium quinoa TaxID=63459 RepID=UPI000B7819A1|nr:copper-transporting ATPase PAA2, chloroplastic-like isoform X2 [Chenopodium quinoa]